jgi:hypothetical protein
LPEACGDFRRWPNRAIATLYDQLAESFLGMLFIASARYWIKLLHAA